MQLSVAERLVLLQVLPREGDFTTLKIVRKLREDLSFDEDEHAALELNRDGGRVTWNTGAAHLKDIPIGEKAADIIVEALRQLDRAKKLTEQHLSVYEKFVERPLVPVGGEG